MERRGRGGTARCSCEDAVKRGVLCKHIAFAAMSELGLAAAARSAHRHLQVLGR
ncbi:SWIM zinc finger family protein [Desulfallas thermosapovorans]|uniref:SWIM zinc finger family protein n=1 Tax=Desulfallas thermosapovorans TaxID=58137 RepID=UPI001FAA2709|nr:SWIM zinc finger family protein [Desulfallas thermosapovorans]